jgi:hypothetical protein
MASFSVYIINTFILAYRKHSISRSVSLISLSSVQLGKAPQSITSVPGKKAANVSALFK